VEVNVKHQYALLLLASSLFWLNTGCDNVVKDEHSPQVTPEIVEVETSSVTVKWNNVGEQYCYSVLLAYDSILDNDFRNADIFVHCTKDTIVTIDSLISNAWYKVKVRTSGGNLSPNESWPPLRFKTE